MPIRVPTVDMQVGGTPPMQQAGDIVPYQDPQAAHREQAAQGLARLGEVVSQIEEREQDLIDTAETKSKANQLREAILRHVGTYTEQLGQKAIDSRQETIDKITEARRTIEGQLQNSTQQRMFGPTADWLMSSGMEEVTGHFRKQARAYAYAEAKTRLQGVILDGQRGAMRGGDVDETYRAARFLIDKESAAMADSMGFGMDSAQRKELREEALTQLHLGIIEGYLMPGEDGLAQDPQKAREWLEKHRDEIRRPVGRGASTGAAGATERRLSRAEVAEDKITKAEIDAAGNAIYLKAKGAPLLAAIDAIDGLPDTVPVAVKDNAKARLKAYTQEVEDARSKARTEVLREFKTWANLPENRPTLLLPPQGAQFQLELPDALAEKITAHGLGNDVREMLATGEITATSSLGRDFMLRVTPAALREMTPADVETISVWHLDKGDDEKLASMWRIANGVAKDADYREADMSLQIKAGAVTWHVVLADVPATDYTAADEQRLRQWEIKVRRMAQQLADPRGQGVAYGPQHIDQAMQLVGAQSERVTTRIPLKKGGTRDLDVPSAVLDFGVPEEHSWDTAYGKLSQRTVMNRLGDIKKLVRDGTTTQAAVAEGRMRELGYTGPITPDMRWQWATSTGMPMIREEVARLVDREKIAGAAAELKATKVANMKEFAKRWGTTLTVRNLKNAAEKQTAIEETRRMLRNFVKDEAYYEIIDLAIEDLVKELGGK